MATKIDGDAIRRDLIFIDPFDVDVREDLRGRRFPPTDQQIIEMAMSIFDHDQRQPVECRKIAGTNKLQSIAGFTRTNAVRLIREGFTGTDGVERHDPEFRLQAKLVTCNDETALVNNIVENAHRNQTSDIDDAYNQNRLRERYGKSDADIARLYQYQNSNKVSRLKRLLELTDDEQLLVHRGVLPTQAAIDMLDLPADQRAKIVADAEQNGKVKASDVADQVREHILRDDGTRDADGDVVVEGSRTKARTIRNLRRFFETTRDEEFDPAIKSFCRSMLKFMGGTISDQAMTNAMNRLLLAEETDWEYVDAA
jgi:ParB-like chromosome segregation protein Spo0J